MINWFSVALEFKMEVQNESIIVCLFIYLDNLFHTFILQRQLANWVFLVRRISSLFSLLLQLLIAWTLFITFLNQAFVCSICLKLLGLGVNVRGKLLLLSTGHFFIFIIVSTDCGYFSLWCFRWSVKLQAFVYWFALGKHLSWCLVASCALEDLSV